VVSLLLVFVTISYGFTDGEVKAVCKLLQGTMVADKCRDLKSLCKERDDILRCRDSAVIGFNDRPVPSFSLRTKFPIEVSYLTKIESFATHGAGRLWIGTIPNVFANLTKLVSLTISRHELTGTIPKMPTNLKSLELSFMSIIGNIPKLTNLVRLSLTYTSITGTIPVLPKIAYLHLGENKLSGTLPDMQGIIHLDVSHSNITGKIPKLPLVDYLDISRNAISGTIPYMPYVNELFAHSNRLSGTIPQYVSSKLYEVIDIRYNALTGNFPTIVAQICDFSGNDFNCPRPENDCNVPQC